MEVEAEMKALALSLVIGMLVGVAIDRFLFGAAVHAQESASLSIGSEAVFVGMPKDMALAKFAGKYEIDRMDANAVVIGENAPKRIVSLGVLKFENGRVKSVSRYWADLWQRQGQRDYDLEAFWNGLHGVLAQTVGQTSMTVQIEAISSKLPGSQDETILLHLPKKRNVEIARLHVDTTPETNFHVLETVF
jgi:hypothetical protein